MVAFNLDRYGCGIDQVESPPTECVPSPELRHWTLNTGDLQTIPEGWLQQHTFDYCQKLATEGTWTLSGMEQFILKVTPHKGYLIMTLMVPEYTPYGVVEVVACSDPAITADVAKFAVGCFSDYARLGLANLGLPSAKTEQLGWGFVGADLKTPWMTTTICSGLYDLVRQGENTLVVPSITQATVLTWLMKTTTDQE